MRPAKRISTAALIAAIGASILTVPQAAAMDSAQSSRSAEHRHGSLQESVDAIAATGSIGVLAQSTSHHRKRYATAGTADIATGRAVHPNDRFRIASSTKTFVATVILQLVGEGRLSLNDTVDRWLPGVVSGNGNNGANITVRQLLQHTSGLYNYTADIPMLASVDGFQNNRYTTWTERQLVAMAMNHHPDFAPGTRWAYSNTNYILAGMIIRKVTGRSWQQEVTERIIRPLGLHRTLAPTIETHIPGRHLHGYSNFGGSGKTVDTTEFNPTAAGAAGGIISTTADLTRFYTALLGGRLLQPAQLSEMKTTVFTPDLDIVWPGASYGLGLMRIPLTCGGSYYSHAGDFPGYTTRDGVTEDGQNVVVLETTGDGATDLSTEQAQNNLIDRELCATQRQ